MNSSSLLCTSFATLMLVIPSVALAQDRGEREGRQARQDPATLIARRDAKLKSAFLRAASWVTDYGEAKRKAKRSGKLVLIYFTRSYAPCPPCETLEEQVLSASGFKKAEGKVVLFCHVTSRVASDPNQGLLEQLGGESFPFFAVVDEQGQPVARLRGILTLEAIQDFLDGDVRAYSTLRDKAAKGDKSARAEFLLKRLELGHIGPEDARLVIATADYLTPAQRKKIGGALASIEVIEVLGRIDEKDPKTMAVAADRLLNMKRAGRIPAGRMAFPFWQILIAHANEVEDVELFGEALDRIKELSGTRIDKPWLTKMENRLKLLRFMKGRKKDGK